MIKIADDCAAAPDDCFRYIEWIGGRSAIAAQVTVFMDRPIVAERKPGHVIPLERVVYPTMKVSNFGASPVAGWR